MAILLVNVQTTVEIEVDDAALHEDCLIDAARIEAEDILTTAFSNYNTRFTLAEPKTLIVKTPDVDEGVDVYDL